MSPIMLVCIVDGVGVANKYGIKSKQTNMRPSPSALRRASLVNLDVLSSHLDRVIIATLDLIVDAKFCNITG